MTTPEREVGIRLDERIHNGRLGEPHGAARGLVIFAHGSGSSHTSPRNAFVARYLRDQKLATLLFDLLTEEEDRAYENRFDIPLLARRLVQATDWALGQPALQQLAPGYFGASTGAAAALIAAAECSAVRAVVSRGGRPDLAMEVLPRVRAATLLIVGGHDEVVLELNEAAYARLTSIKALKVIPGATHLFEEPGALERVAQLAADWFVRYLGEATEAP